MRCATVVLKWSFPISVAVQQWCSIGLSLTVFLEQLVVFFFGGRMPGVVALVEYQKKRHNINVRTK